MSLLTQAGPANTTLAKRRQLFESLKDREYRFAFVPERVRSSIALQIRALREQRNRMTQKQLGESLGMAQTWVSKLENPEYGKMTVATLLRLAEAFDSDLEIKFRPFSSTINEVSTQGPDYFTVPSFDEEKDDIEKTMQREEFALLTSQSLLLGSSGLLEDVMEYECVRHIANKSFMHHVSAIKALSGLSIGKLARTESFPPAFAPAFASAFTEPSKSWSDAIQTAIEEEKNAPASKPQPRENVINIDTHVDFNKSLVFPIEASRRAYAG